MNNISPIGSIYPMIRYCRIDCIEFYRNLPPCHLKSIFLAKKTVFSTLIMVYTPYVKILSPA